MVDLYITSANQLLYKIASKFYDAVSVNAVTPTAATAFAGRAAGGAKYLLTLPKNLKSSLIYLKLNSGWLVCTAKRTQLICLSGNLEFLTETIKYCRILPVPTFPEYIILTRSPNLIYLKEVQIEKQDLPGINRRLLSKIMAAHYHQLPLNKLNIREFL